VGPSRIDVNAVVELGDLPSVGIAAEQLDLTLWLTPAGARKSGRLAAHEEFEAACEGQPDDLRQFVEIFGRRRFVRGSATAGFAPPDGDACLLELDETAAELGSGTYAAAYF
jgi:hypothetical protein